MEEALLLRTNYGEIVRRRLPVSLLVGVVLLVITLALALGLPSVYRSRAVVLIEAQEIPQDLVRSLVTSYADQRMQTISQRVLTNSNLASIIEKYNLYEDERSNSPLELVLGQMRKEITVTPISADVVDPKQGRAVQATIAFELAYENQSPQLAQRVANEVVSLFLNENLKQRSETSTETLDFLSSESERLRATVADLEAKLAEFKHGNVERLPELTNLNFELINRTDQELAQTQGQLQSLQQQRTYLESELAQQKPHSMLVSETGERILGPRDRLKILESEFVPLAARYGANHPDVQAKRKEIESLRSQVGVSEGSNETALRLQRAEADYASTLKKYAADHPDVKRLAREVEALRAQVANPPVAALPVSVTAPDNPVYIQLKARLQGTDADISSSQAQIAGLKAKRANLEDRITKSPEVERQYRMLSRDYDSAQLKYQEVQAKRQEAELASSLESKQRGERFNLIEPPVVPEEPAKPHRLAIALLGVLLSIFAAVGTGALAENMDGRVYGRSGVMKLLSVPPLAVIPRLETSESVFQVRRRYILSAAALLFSVVLGLILVHFMVMPLDVLFYRALRKFEF